MPRYFMKPVLLRISEATKNGKSEGNTMLKQRFMPFKADLKEVDEREIRLSIKIKQTSIKIFLFIKITFDIIK